MYNHILVIPTKGRAGKCRAVEHLFPLLSCKKCLVVEPQDYQEYRDAYGDKVDVYLTLDQNNKGIGYARRFAQEAFKDCIVAMIDDDVYSFRKRDGVTDKGYPKLAPANAEGAIKYMFHLAEEFGYAGLSASQLNFMMKTEPYSNGRIWNAYSFSPKAYESGVKFDPELMLFEDFDFHAQAIMKGFKSPLSSMVCFETNERIGLREGGCQSFDRKALSEKMFERIQAKWGDVVKPKIHKTNGFLEPQFSWRTLRKMYESHRTDLPHL